MRDASPAVQYAYDGPTAPAAGALGGSHVSTMAPLQRAGSQFVAQDWHGERTELLRQKSEGRRYSQRLATMGCLAVARLQTRTGVAVGIQAGA
jgi:hypothetical protein